MTPPASDFEGYLLDVILVTNRPLRVDNEAVEVALLTKGGDVYQASAMTPKYLGWLFEKNAKTGECAGGSYFAGCDTLFVKDIAIPTLRKTVDDLIQDELLLDFFHWRCPVKEYVALRHVLNIQISDVTPTFLDTER
jgi:hypothetical protein